LILPFYPSRFLAQDLCTVSLPWRAPIIAHFSGSISPSDDHSIVKIHTLHFSIAQNEGAKRNSFFDVFYFQRDAQRCYSLVKHFDERPMRAFTKPSHLVGSENAFLTRFFEK